MKKNRENVTCKICGKIKLKVLNNIMLIDFDPEDRFTGLPVLTEKLDGDIFRLVRAVTYRTKDGRTITVRTPFKFDWASIPRFLQGLYPPAGTKGNPYGIAAIFHDWLCAHRKIGGRPITFSEANSVFKEIMLYLGCRPTLAWTMYLAVQGPFGWWAWHKRKPENIIP